MRKLVALFDRHYGWEKKRIGGKLQNSATHDQKLFNNVLEFIGDFDPDILIDGGDGFNMSPISRHTRSRPRLVEGFSLKREYDEAWKNQLGPLTKTVREDCKKYFLKGNHEYWVEILLDENPTLEGLLEPHSYLDLEGNGWEVVEYGGIVKVGSKLHVVHGDNLRFAGIHRAAALLRGYNKNVLCGHFHTAQMFTNVSMANEHPYMALTAPMMGNPDVEYLNRKPSSYVQGFVYGYIQDNGNFNLYPVIATKGKFVVGGKLYG